MALDRQARDPVMTVDNLVEVGMSYRRNEDGRSCSRLTRAPGRSSGNIGESSIDKVAGDLDDAGGVGGREVLPGDVDAASSHPAIRRVENFLVAEVTGVAGPAEKIGVRPVDNSARRPEEITGGCGVLARHSVHSVPPAAHHRWRSDCFPDSRERLAPARDGCVAKSAACAASG